MEHCKVFVMMMLILITILIIIIIIVLRLLLLLLLPYITGFYWMLSIGVTYCRHCSSYILSPACRRWLTDELILISCWVHCWYL